MARIASDDDISQRYLNMARARCAAPRRAIQWHAQRKLYMYARPKWIARTLCTMLAFPMFHSAAHIVCPGLPAVAIMENRTWRGVGPTLSCWRRYQTRICVRRGGNQSNTKAANPPDGRCARA